VPHGRSAAGLRQQRPGLFGAGIGPAGRARRRPARDDADRAEAGTQLLYYFAGSESTQLLLSGSGAYGFTASVGDMVSRQKAGKAFVTLGEGETLCAPSVVHGVPMNARAEYVEGGEQGAGCSTPPAM
jgi:topoisomerase-4 subunit A